MRDYDRGEFGVSDEELVEGEWGGWGVILFDLKELR